MANITRTYSSTTDVVTGASILAAHINTDLDKVYSELNGALDNTNISASAAIDISKTALGTYTAPTTYSPTWTADSGANPAIGDGTLTGFYTRVGKVVFFLWDMTAGSTTTFGTAANWRIGLPATASATYKQSSISAYVLDTGSAEKQGYGGVVGAGEAFCQIGHDSGGFFDSGTPQTWATGDRMIVQGWYFVD